MRKQKQLEHPPASVLPADLNCLHPLPHVVWVKSMPLCTPTYPFLASEVLLKYVY